MKHIKVWVSCCCLSFTIAFAEDFSPLPQGVHKLGYAIQAATANQFGTSSNKTQDWLAYLANKNNQAGVQGKLSYTTVEHHFTYQYGLSDDWLLWFVVPYLQKTRQSTASTQSAVVATQNFVNSLGTVKTSGTGDVDLGLLYKISAFKGYYAQLGGGALLKTSEKIIDETTKLSTGSGANGAYALLRISNYSLSSTFHSMFEFKNFWYFKSKVQHNGDSTEWLPGKKWNFKGRFAWKIEDWVWGFGLFTEQQGQSLLAKKAENNAYRKTQGLIFAKLISLSDSPAYELNLSYNQNFQSYNAPVQKQVSLSLDYFF